MLSRTSTLVLFLTAACGAPPAAPPAAPCPACAPAPTASVAAPAPARGAPHPTLSAFERLVGRIEAQDCDAIYASFNDNMQKALGADKTREICQGLGKAAPFISVRLTKLSGQTGEWVLTHAGGELHASLTLDDDGKIAGTWFRPPPPPPAPVAKTTVALRAPFEGRWHVFWGGDTLAKNKHMTHQNQRRAVDLVVLGDDGKSHSGDGKKNEDYYAYGKKILSVANGTVVTVIDGVPDNAPGVMNGYSAVGNAVIVQHADGEFALYAHLIPGSIKVKPKAKVRAGQLLGLCGNSGNSSEPHLHFHVQDRADVATAIGLEPVLSRVTRERGGEKTSVEGYVFEKGDTVAP